ncbi:MAG: hypothetical protein ACKVOR_07420, partial [Flavobacteriales bacterium]
QTRTDDIALNKLPTNFKQLCLERTAWRTHNIRLKEILERRALFGNQTVVLLSNSCGLTNSGASTLVRVFPSF